MGLLFLTVQICSARTVFRLNWPTYVPCACMANPKVCEPHNLVYKANKTQICRLLSSSGMDRSVNIWIDFVSYLLISEITEEETILQLSLWVPRLSNLIVQSCFELRAGDVFAVHGRRAGKIRYCCGIHLSAPPNSTTVSRPSPGLESGTPRGRHILSAKIDKPSR